jgi:Tol biopolymer transport system component
MWGFYTQSVDGIGEAREILINDFNKWPGSWSQDGKALNYPEGHPETGTDLMIYSTETPDKPRPFLRSVSNEVGPEFSPNGRWVAYVSDEAGPPEVFVVSYPEPHTKRKVSRDGGYSPRWSTDGTRIYFSWADWLMVSQFSEEGNVTTSLPEKFVQGVDDYPLTWDVAPDDSHVVALEKRPSPQLRLVLNWFDELKRLVPTESN